MVKPTPLRPRDSNSDDDSDADHENLPLTARSAQKLKAKHTMQDTSYMSSPSEGQGVFDGDANPAAEQQAAAPAAAADASAPGNTQTSTDPLAPQVDTHSTLPLQPPQHKPAQGEIEETRAICRVARVLI